MSTFNIQKTEKTPKQWQAEAVQKIASENNSQFIIGSSIIGGLALSVFATPIVGGLVALWGLVNGLQKGVEASRTLQAVKDVNCVANALSGQDFKSYLAQSDKEKVLAELRYALDNNLCITDDAWDYIEENQNTSPENSSDAPFLPGSPVTIEQNTIAVRSIPGQRPIELTKNICSSLKRVIVYGVPSAGKDFFISHILRDLKSPQSQFKSYIFYMDCKDIPEEYGYYQGIADKAYQMSIYKSNPSLVWDWVKMILEDYDNHACGDGESKVLVCTELAALNSTLDLLPKDKKTGIKPIDYWTHKLSTYASSGDAEGCRMIFGSQNGHNKGIKLSGGDKAIFKPFLIAREDSLSENSQIMQAGIMANSSKLPVNEIQELCKKSPVKRAIFHGGLNKWLPMPKLENFAGYNRDSQQWENKPITTQSIPINETAKIIMLLESSAEETIDDFIAKELKPKDFQKHAKLKRAILKALTQTDRIDLLSRFGANEKEVEKVQDSKKNNQ